MIKTIPEILNGIQIYLRRLKPSDVSMEYVNWLNDPQVNQYLECRFMTHTLEDVEKYVDQLAQDKNHFLFGIFNRSNEAHIGNIKLGLIDFHHHRGDIGIMIGERNYWGKGFATEAIQTMVKFGFDVLKLHKITAGAYANNLGSIRAFEKAGFRREGARRKHYFLESQNQFVDGVLMGILRTDEFKREIS